jgi:hypothetical protein
VGAPKTKFLSVDADWATLNAQRTGHCFTKKGFSIPEHWYVIAASALALPNKQKPKTNRPDVRGCLRKRAPENSSAQGTTQNRVI